ncbi:MAG: lipid A biosynthesis acyltransferase [Acidobacteria bacterium]|nr:MAG: lipid A biosynthesis acyltransferase [Acidobacteriota bacterium]
MSTETETELEKSTAPAAAETPIWKVEPSRFATALFHVLGIRRRIVMANMRVVFGDQLSASELERLAKAFYLHFFRVIRENLAMFWRTDRRLADMVDVVGVEHLFEAGEKGQGILILTGHFGNWELTSIAAMLQYKEYRDRFFVIRKSLSAGLEHVLFRRFHQAGLQVIPPFNTLSQVLQALASNDVVIFILDQHTMVDMPKGIAVDFFGRTAGTNRSLALLTAHSGAPVIPAIAYRKNDGRHVVRFEKPLEWIYADDPEEEIRLNTQHYNDVLERFVLEHPEQWFWAHRRWKYSEEAETKKLILLGRRRASRLPYEAHQHADPDGNRHQGPPTEQGS